jgi:4-aminobutyrate aminotransferase-like enzyme
MTETLLDRRARLLGPNVPTFYDTPLHLVRGDGVWMWDADGKRYLDCYNNVPHVGHGHPEVVEAIARQASTLNTHTRYLHDGILDYAEALTATLGHDLSQMIFTCTGSEANDIALRAAQAVTGQIGILATDTTYHGNTAATSALSTRRPPIGGYPPHVRLVPAPVAGMTPDGFAAHVEAAIADLARAGFGLSGMMLCPVFANEGLPPVAPGFFAPAEAAIRKAGGLILCDEVQPGFGRCGSHFWGHDWLGMTPDLITLGKPMGNGYPVAGLVARADVMAAFRQAFGYFNTFGGSPVAAAAAHATLRIVQRDGLQDNARRTGAYTLDRLRGLSHPKLTAVHGLGLFFALTFQDGDAPATAFATALVERVVGKGVLLNRIGPQMNILKIRPPMPFQPDHADLLVAALADALSEMPE